jgi:hypothetical protein
MHLQCRRSHRNLHSKLSLIHNLNLRHNLNQHHQLRVKTVPTLHKQRISLRHE